MERKKSCRLRHERGQSLALFALLLMFAFIGFLALTIDLGLQYGQRRFDQNGADAAVLAAAQYMAGNIAFANQAGTSLYVSAPDADIYSKVQQYAGLTASHDNQNSALSGRTSLNATLEYAADGTNWCYSPSGAPDPTVPVCTLFAVNGVGYPPLTTDNPYKVRVIVRSASDSFFAQAIPGGNGNLGQGNAACQPSPSATGMLTCAQATAVIYGATKDEGSSAVIPVAAPNCLVGSTPGTLYELWGSSGTLTCPDGTTFSYQNWASIVDLTSDTTWCDDPSGGSSSNPDYKYYSALPPASQVSTGICQTLPTATWNRTGFSPDPNYPSGMGPTWHSGIEKYDLEWWIAKGFHGTVDIGNNVPTYLDVNPGSAGGGNQGQNVAAGFYCGTGVTADACPTSVNPSGTYFFAQNQQGFHDDCSGIDPWVEGYSGVGCRDAAVILWSNPEVASGSTWSATNSAPYRITVADILNFRIYCEHDGNGYCTRPPGDIVGTWSNSTVWGRFVSPYVPGGIPPHPPTIYGNSASLAG